jgi:acyl-[acyl-carrier-protein]-phospholipid O-acyltransferase/long-chain-fatty-acid--[acyl-carrier-protein] ligase
MQGYLNDPERTDKTIIERDGIRWYVSGDKGHVDEDGFLVIVDRYSRFAKLGGEMISLSAVENAVRTSLNDADIGLIAVNIPDEKKGEKVVLITSGGIALQELRQAMLAAEVNPLLIPAAVMQVEQLPLLGSGKVDFSHAKQLAAGHS